MPDATVGSASDADELSTVRLAIGTGPANASEFAWWCSDSEATLGIAMEHAADSAMSSPASDSDSDYEPNGKTRTLRITRPSAAQAAPVAMEAEEEEDQDAESSDDEEAIVPTRRSKAPRQSASASTLLDTDDGCAGTFAKRIQAFETLCRISVRDQKKSFYNKPKPRAKANGHEDEDIDEEDWDADDGGFIDDKSTDEDATETNPEELYYTPDDIVTTDSGLTVPAYVQAHLFPHQIECLEWLHRLHEQNTGGILGDEMGLGKTVQIAAFLGALHHARRVRTVLLLCPASVLMQWVREFHKWYPQMRVLLLHSSGSGVALANRSYQELIDEVTAPDYGDEEMPGGGVIVTTYENVRQYQEMFLPIEWDYVVLDEGHRIRNPDAEITLVCKHFKTVHRIILTGTPIQNRLKELWSLFDFVFPGKLGTLPTFDDEFVLPIRTGGYANASKMQVLMAYKCALVLKDLINPYLLRRTKREIQQVTKMPEKMEQILFCNLCETQVEAYKRYLNSSEVASVIRRDIRPFRAISILRHICNHPDLLLSVGEDGERGLSSMVPARDESASAYGSAEASGKMMVLKKILGVWKQQGHRVLLFTQTRKMLDILESFVAGLGYEFCRLDGTTSVKERPALLDAFNAEDSKIFIFLLTTRAGGIGVNLVGADRVVIFDPDWNPSTDLQARERSWRLGQKKQVTIYRLITSGTIEERIYHRQIFKQYLTTKVLHDAKRKRCFNKHTLRDLFVLGDQQEKNTVETNDLFLAGNVERPAEETQPPKEEGEVEESPAPDAMEVDAENEDRTSVDDAASLDQPDQPSGAGDNDALLKQLFDGEGLRGVFNHEAVECDGIQNQEADLIAMESEKIAKSALSSLRASCALIRQQRETIYTPTWTGRSGVAGDPTQRKSPAAGAKKRFGSKVARGRQSVRSMPPASSSRANPFAEGALSSRDMLSKIKMRRNGVAQTPDPPVAPARRGGAIGGFLTVDEMTKQLHAFLSQSSARPRDGVTTEQLLDAFGSVVAPKDKMVFRNVLRDIAVCEGRKWRLKKDFRL